MDDVDEQLIQHYAWEVEETLNKMYGKMSNEAQEAVLVQVERLIREKRQELDEDTQ